MGGGCKSTMAAACTGKPGKKAIEAIVSGKTGSGASTRAKEGDFLFHFIF